MKDKDPFEIKNPCKMRDLLRYANKLRPEENQFTSAIMEELNKGPNTITLKHICGTIKLLYTTIGKDEYVDVACAALAAVSIATPTQLDTLCINVQTGEFGYLKNYKGDKIDPQRIEDISNNLKQIIVELQIPRN